ncbi:uncharacterized protein EDB91DRAFT_1128710 [Suillus paluster]|uniref:uncharacterized protein n=1 Tax=Suillus paluster TaxID=48578 RepID=UPI001B86A721|nr:uncharacterized protein EDB91DRAFT_1128710 [Suillus paluster]KAG1742332.1 hypothetical protein EDB91DRAFT_1128710 [Suillus paluster]
MMTHNELWLTYHQASRYNKPATAQLVELEFQNQKLTDLEDVLEHLFRQGFIEAQHRSLSYWENHDGQRLDASHAVEELLTKGAGKCPQSALRLVIADRPTHLWFSYVYTHKNAGPAVTQRVKFCHAQEAKLEMIAHLTNHIFRHGFLPPRLRTVVTWQGLCGRKIEEHETLDALLAAREGLSETLPLRLMIDAACTHTGTCHAAACH